ncbi:MAG: UbiD family decarboxylase, partial [Desulfobulbaceae bacterium]|nr:UbiD family decarboxylase [Desulfobulbaceae bacterium]
MIKDLRSYINILRKESDLLEIDVEVDPYLEIAEIHRRVIAQGGPALLFNKVKGSPFPVATNLFGTARRMEISFGHRAQKFVADLVRAVEVLMPPSLGKIWSMRGLVPQAARIGTKIMKTGPILDNCMRPARMT